MADDRHEAYRAMFTRTKIREILERLEHQEAVDFVYRCIENALLDEGAWTTVNNIIAQTQNEDEQS